MCIYIYQRVQKSSVKYEFVYIRCVFTIYSRIQLIVWLLCSTKQYYFIYLLKNLTTILMNISIIFHAFVIGEGYS